MNDIWRLSATELASQIRSKKLSAREAASAAIARLNTVNPAHQRSDRSPPWTRRWRRADAVDAAIAKGADAGPLAGVPITVKVNVDQAGFATTNGLTPAA